MWLLSRTLISSALDVQCIPSLRDPALEDRAHPQLAANHARFCFFSLVTESGVSRHHFQIRQLRQAVNEALGEAVAQVFGVWITAGVHEGQNRQRVYRFSASTGPSVEPAGGRQCRQQDNHDP
jgi:hypothetical protein